MDNNQNKNNLISSPEVQINKPNPDNYDLKKAITFLLGKELKDFSLEKKKEYLSKKISPETLEKALELYPIIEANTNSKLEEFSQEYEKKENKKGFFEGLFDLGVLSTVIISTLGINYLLDLQRNKKNDIFYKECEKKLNDEFKKMTENIKKEISTELSNFSKKDEVEEKIKEKIQLISQNSGLNLNLSSKNIKENMNNLKTDLTIQDKKIKEMSVKLDNNSVMVKQEILNEITNLIDQNNKTLLMKIIELQNNLIYSNKNNISNLDKVEDLKNYDISLNNNHNSINFKNSNLKANLNNNINNTNENNLDNSTSNKDLFDNSSKNLESKNNNQNILMYNLQKPNINEIKEFFHSTFENNNEKERDTDIIEKKEVRNIFDQNLNTYNNVSENNISNLNQDNLPNPIMMKKTSLNPNEIKNIPDNQFEDKNNNFKKEETFLEAYNIILNSLEEKKRSSFNVQIKVREIIFKNRIIFQRF